MRNVAAGLMSTFGEALLRPGDNERDLGLRYAETLRNLGPLAAPTLGHMLNLRMREVIRDAAVGQAELHSGHLPGAQPVTVGFVDIVGFTRLGEEIPPEDLGELVRDFERSVERATIAPVRLVKTIGDAAMLVSPTPKPVVDAVLGLVEQSRGRRGPADAARRVASGEALQRVGDWYGRPVNLAARLTSFARRGWVVASKDVHDATPTTTPGRSRATAASRASARTWPVYRVRPAEPARCLGVGRLGAAEAGGLAQRVSLVGLLPGEVVVLAAEVAVGRRLLVDRPVQVERLAERARAEVEVLVDQPRDLRAGDLLGAERLDHHRHRVRHADRVGHLHLAAVREARGHHVLGHVARGVGGRTVDLRRVLARERAAAVAGHAAVGVDDDLAAGEAAVADRAADHELAGRVDEEVAPLSSSSFFSS